MRFLSRTERSFEHPHAMVQLLLGANIAVFAVCIIQSKVASIPAEVLFRYGAMYSQAIDRQEYWRFIAHGFLHANPLHIVANMLCLVLWGGLLERRLGALYFTLVYVSSMVAGAIVSHLTHSGIYVSVGASGAISGVLGALLCLRLLRRIDLPWSFFVINIALNVALAASSARIDWGAHLGGFVGGVICCSCLDLLEQVFGWLLRCKFPEFVKMNAFLAFAIVAAYVRYEPILARQETWVLASAAVIAGLIVIKGLDLVLSMKKGLAVVVIAFAVANAALVLLLRNVIAQALLPICTARPGATNAFSTVVARACTDVDLTINVAAMSAFALTMLIYGRPLARGISDVGFVGASLRGERNRHHGA